MFRHLACLVFVSTPLAIAYAQRPHDDEGFVVCLGDDTLAVERYTRSATTLESEIVLRVPAARRVTYTAALDAIGDVRSMELVVTPLLESSLPPRVSHGILRFRGDTADVQLTMGDSTWVLKVPARPGSMPLAAFSHALVEQAILRASHLGLDSVPFDWVGVGAPVAYPTYVTRRKDGDDRGGVLRCARDSYHGFQRSHAGARRDRHDRQGGGQAGHGAGSRALRTRLCLGRGGPWAGRSAVASRHGMGRDRSRAHDGGLRAAQPARSRRVRSRGAVGTSVADRSQRGYAIHDGYTAPDRGPEDSRRHLQPLDPAEAGRRDVDPESPDRRVGTHYERTFDLARIEMERETLAEPLEQFTIAIEPGEDGGLLRLSWDSTSYHVPMSVVTQP